MMMNFMSRKNIRTRQNFKGGASMKFLLITLMTMAGLMAQDPPDLFSHNASQIQSFYYFVTVTIDGASVASDDWVGAFNGDVCVGARKWDTSECGEGICEVPAMGDDGQNYSNGYLNFGDIPTFKIFDFLLEISLKFFIILNKPMIFTLIIEFISFCFLFFSIKVLISDFSIINKDIIILYYHIIYI